MSRIVHMQASSPPVGLPTSPTTRPRERRTKAKIACAYCRIKKIKCEGGRPCPNCLDHDTECAYPVVKRHKSRAPEREVSLLRDRLARVEARLSRSNTVWSETRESAALATLPDSQFMPPPPSIPGIVEGDFAAATALASLQTLPEISECSRDELPPSPCATTRSSLPSYPSEAHPDPSSSKDDDDGSSVGPPEEELTFEYHGPGSFLSICSKSGVEWVQGKTGDKSFVRLARSLTHNIAQRLKMVNAITPRREPEPSFELSWQYVHIYFDKTPEASLGIICRTSFEARLRAHHEQASHISSSESDPAWYALRHAVFAIGCRASLAKDSSVSFRTAHEHSWKYFQNALSMYTELHFSRTGLMAVQALTVMSLYTEGIESPALDYMLVSSALKLAEAKGLHRQPAKAWNLSDKAIQIRSSIWWFLYTFDRLIAFRSGRPLVSNLLGVTSNMGTNGDESVGDENINCQLPRAAPDGERCVEVFISMITHAQISSQIATAIAKMRSSNPNLKEVVSTITQLDQKLRSWRAQLPAYIDFDKPLDVDRLPTFVYSQHFFYLLFSYYGALTAIHSIIVQPWNAIAVQVYCDQRDQLSQQVQQSSETLVLASRKIIEQLPYVKIEPSTHKWLVLTFPLTAVFNLFIHVLQHPGLPSTESDINLMYTAAGHYNYLEFLSPDQKFPFVRELANMARKTVSEAKSNIGKPTGTINSSIPSTVSKMQPFEHTFETVTLPSDTFQFNGMGMANFNDEDWGTLLVRDDWSYESPLSLVPSIDIPML